MAKYPRVVGELVWVGEAWKGQGDDWFCLYGCGAIAQIVEASTAKDAYITAHKELEALLHNDLLDVRQKLGELGNA